MPTTTDQATTHQQVFSTRRYSQFRLLNANREVNRNHVNALIASMEENGNFTEAQPILVNEHMEVIDGQHRLEACRALGLPVYYTQLPDLNINQARAMNLMHRRWNANDYLESYAEEGRRAYVELRMLKEEFPGLAMTTLVTYALGWKPSGFNSDFRNGDTPVFDLNAARERMGLLNELIGLSDAFKIKAFQDAFLTALNTHGYDHQRMVRKVRQAGPDLRAYQNVSDNLREIENVYNEGMSEANRLRFF